MNPPTFSGSSEALTARMMSRERVPSFDAAAQRTLQSAEPGGQVPGRLHGKGDGRPPDPPCGAAVGEVRRPTCWWHPEGLDAFP